MKTAKILNKGINYLALILGLILLTSVIARANTIKPSDNKSKEIYTEITKEVNPLMLFAGVIVVNDSVMVVVK